MEEKIFSYEERLKRLRDMLIKVDEEASELSREGSDIRRDISRFLDKAKLQNVSKLIENIK
ncbi:MAG: hypothetical protein NTW66_02300 [Candidatus Magasanikbacteria bacterium]|nr:hypothetical protein [Candidatus Magasanikbacteria bacterium]